MAPDPLDVYSFNWRMTQVSTGYTYRFIDQVPEKGDVATAQTILCIHGFPDLAYGWRYQIVDFVKRGYRVVVPDQIGFGGTDKPINTLEPYGMIASAKAMREILESIGVKGRYIVLGHDWGGAVAWKFLRLYPERVLCFASVCTPPSPAAQKGDASPDFATTIRTRFPHFGYQLYFATDEAAQDLDANLEAFLRPLLSPRERLKAAERIASGNPGEDWTEEGKLRSLMKAINGAKEGQLVDEPEFRVYLDAFRQGGFRAPLNWYKVWEKNREADIAAGLPPTYPPDVPVLFLPATHDKALPPSMTSSESLKKLFPGGNIERRVLENADHWCLQDAAKRDEVTKVLGDWIDEQARSTASSKL